MDDGAADPGDGADLTVGEALLGVVGREHDGGAHLDLENPRGGHVLRGEVDRLLDAFGAGLEGQDLAGHVLEAVGVPLVHLGVVGQQVGDLGLRKPLDPGAQDVGVDLPQLADPKPAQGLDEGQVVLAPYGLEADGLEVGLLPGLAAEGPVVGFRGVGPDGW